MTAAWWDGYPPAQAFIECSGTTHRLRWDEGELQALDHNDPAGERVLAGLSGEPCACIEILNAWKRHERDLRVLVLGSRGRTDRVQPQPDGLSPRRHLRQLMRGVAPPMAGSATVAFSVGSVSGYSPVRGAFGVGPVGAMGMPKGDELFELVTLGGGLSDRLTATVAAYWAEKLAAAPHDIAERPALIAALTGRAMYALREWLADADLEVSVELIDRGEVPTVTATGHGVHLALSLDWIVNVATRGIAVILDHFTLGVLESRGGRLTLITTTPTFDGTHRITIDIT